MKTIYIIGAGQIGSRHLQALKKIKTPLNIIVVDPSQSSLATAKQRYNEFKAPDSRHIVQYKGFLDNIDKIIDIVIVATSSNVRREIIEIILERAKVKYLILEKLLFQKYEDYRKVEQLFRKCKAKAWVNCSMRTIPFYAKLNRQFDKCQFQYIVSGSGFGLVTTAIHYIDHISYLTNCYDFDVDTSSLQKKLVLSKRKGFFELYGTIRVLFKNGTFGIITSYPSGDAPNQIEILNDNVRCICWEGLNKAMISEAKNRWKWVNVKPNILLQSEMTTAAVEGILKNGMCNLTPYAQSSKLHTTFLQSMLKHINSFSKRKFDYYPFT